MKIAVCVKAVPDAAAGRRIDPATKRLDRSGELAISDFDTYAVEEGLKLKEASGEGEVVVVSMGPEKAMDALRKALAMGADRAVLITDSALEDADVLETAVALAGALEQEGADLVLFGQQSADGGGACLWAAVAEKLRCPVVSQVSELTVDGGALTGKRQTEFGYDTIRAPLPAIVAVSDAINTPRYPSLKGIMGAKKKPQETLAAAHVGEAAGPGTTVIALQPAAAARRGAEVRGRRQRGRPHRRVPRREEARLMAKTLVFLEHHEGVVQKGSLGVLAKAAADRRRVRGRDRRLGRAGGRGEASARRFGSPTTRVSQRRCRSRASTCSRKLVRDESYDTVLFGQSVLAADIAAGLAARLGAGLNWGLVDFDGEQGTRAGATGHGRRRRRLVDAGAHRHLPRRARSTPTSCPALGRGP